MLSKQKIKNQNFVKLFMVKSDSAYIYLSSGTQVHSMYLVRRGEVENCRNEAINKNLFSTPVRHYGAQTWHFPLTCNFYAVRAKVHLYNYLHLLLMVFCHDMATKILKNHQMCGGGGLAQNINKVTYHISYT